MPSKAALEIREEYKRWDGHPKPLRTFQDWWVDADALCEEVVRLRQIEGCAAMMAALMAEPNVEKIDLDVFVRHRDAFIALVLGPDPQATINAVFATARDAGSADNRPGGAA